jgi:hypothetical protein
MMQQSVEHRRSQHRVAGEGLIPAEPPGARSCGRSGPSGRENLLAPDEAN